jgi:phosphohistidine phosphatase
MFSVGNIMIFYLIRHAEAVEGSQNLPDEWRYLTRKGRATIIKMRSRIAKHGPKPSVIITSPLVRAVQTAEILAEKLGKKNTVIATGLLNADADIEQFIKHLKKQNDDDCMMIVGHEPFLGSLVTTR